jgi:hypothetical protein
VWGGFHTRNRRRPRAKCAKPPESPSTLGFHAFTLCDPLPQANPCLHVRPGEGTARSPFVTSRSLDTRGAWPSGSNRSRALAAQRPPTLPTCNTALFVVISHLSCIPLAAELRTMNVGQAPALAIFHTPARSNRFVVVPIFVVRLVDLRQRCSHCTKFMSPGCNSMLPYRQTVLLRATPTFPVSTCPGSEILQRPPNHRWPFSFLACKPNKGLRSATIQNNCYQTFFCAGSNRFPHPPAP